MRGRTGLGGLAMAMTIGMTPMPAAALDTVEAKPLTLERLFADPSLDGASLRAVRPSPDGRLVAYLKSRDDDAQRRDLRSEEHTSELQSLMRISYAVFCLKKKSKKDN